ncbi:MAG: hypothetical protein AB7V26_01615 [Lysobacterales bacterium]
MIRKLLAIILLFGLSGTALAYDIGGIANGYIGQGRAWLPSLRIEAGRNGAYPFDVERGPDGVWRLEAPKGPAMSLAISEFLYSALLWGSLVTGLLWWLRRRMRPGIARKLLWLPLGWFGLHTLYAWYGFLVPISGRLIDADSGAPFARVRVYANWTSYPTSLGSFFYNGCSGQQAHVSDADGRFAFRFAPYPTLVYGVLLRGLSPRVPGRIGIGKLGGFWEPLLGDMPFQRYAPGRSTKIQWPNSGCDMTVAPQYDALHRGIMGDWLLPDDEHPFDVPSYRSGFRRAVSGTTRPAEEHPFEVLYREACVERQPWTFNDEYLRWLVWSRPFGQNRLGLWTVPPPALPEDIQGLVQEQLEPRGCSDGGSCAYAVAPEVHDRLCAFLTTERKQQGIRQ